jgi:hypothetical protein
MQLLQNGQMQYGRLLKRPGWEGAASLADGSQN